MQVPVHNVSGEVAENIEVSDDVFGVAWREGVVHQALVRQLANLRLGTVETLTRSTVSGSGRKPFQQKHTGRARRGDATAPILRGGAVAHGPHRRDYRQAMPKRMRRLALRCALSAKASGGELKVLKDLTLEQPRTKELAGVLDALALDGSVLIATSEVDPAVVRAARSIPSVTTTPAALLNVVDVVTHRNLVMTVAAVRRVESLWTPKQRAGQTKE
ncbi:MAG: 50S ribosomal protein L4 [Chloroflexi bacterium]|nr:50S ribosomal protein L4 [Chloroflexota bacterium]